MRSIYLWTISWRCTSLSSPHRLVLTPLTEQIPHSTRTAPATAAHTLVVPVLPILPRPSCTPPAAPVSASHRSFQAQTTVFQVCATRARAQQHERSALSSQPRCVPRGRHLTCTKSDPPLSCTSPAPRAGRYILVGDSFVGSCGWRSTVTACKGVRLRPLHLRLHLHQHWLGVNPSCPRPCSRSSARGGML
ncbi:hypothetical protein GALMADRAFT_1132873 [Galerina marginata CBS 339.88]|uniref:Uncharacterized protein n=1 Tax=Galerina marginata (strain CBS 339.88) TaxID=685588 RepID=A0A067SH30_GALM3|nr:hypothetical protein GALMADRAFT_1132873 [Galerina marginata CBS 339.88]